MPVLVARIAKLAHPSVFYVQRVPGDFVGQVQDRRCAVDNLGTEFS